VKRLLLGGVAALILFGGIFSGRISAAPRPVEDYWRKLEQTRDLVDDLAGEPLDDVRPSLQAAADEWETITELSLPDGAIIPVDHTLLIEQLRAESPDLYRIKDWLDTLLEARENWPRPEGELDTGGLQEILAQPEFQWPESKPSPLTKWLLRLIEKLMELFPGGDGVLELPRILLPILGALALAVVLFFAFRGIFGDLVSESELDLEAIEGGVPLTSAAAIKRAQELSTGGDYRTAVRYLYLSSLLLLEERGLLRYDRSLTNREYLRSVAAHPQLESILREVVEVFDRVWYGYQPLDQAAYERYAARVGDLKQQR